MKIEVKNEPFKAEKKLKMEVKYEINVGTDKDVEHMEVEEDWCMLFY